MKIETNFFRSPLARRVFSLFVLSALVPVAATAVLSFGQVSRLLTNQTHDQLHEASKAYGMTIFERLIGLESDLAELAHVLVDEDVLIDDPHSPIKQPFLAAVVVSHLGDKETLWGDIAELPRLAAAETEHLLNDRVVLSNVVTGDSESQTYASRLIDVSQPDSPVLVVRIAPEVIWGDPEALPLTTNYCVLDNGNRVLYCSELASKAMQEQLAPRLVNSSSGQFEWSSDGEEHLASYWAIFLKARFFNPQWIVIASQPSRRALAPIQAYKRLFPPVLLLSILIVALLSVNQIRKGLAPLDKLIAGTRNIANREFDKRVVVTSGDEFEELADSLNRMARRLGKQFTALTTLSEVDRLILSTLEIEQVLEMVLSHLRDVVTCDVASITLVDMDSDHMARTFIEAPDGEDNVQRVELGERELTMLAEHPGGMLLSWDSAWPRYLIPLKRQGARWFLLVPIRYKGRLTGIISLGYRQKPHLDEEDVKRVRDFADRLAVAFSTVEREEQLYNQAHFDPLTRLPNRQLFKDRLEREIMHAKMEKNLMAVLFIDLDHFKKVNDSVGHSAGDELLKMAAERLRRCVRESDTVARLGGDEFTIILSKINDPTDASGVSEKILELFNQPFDIDHHEHFVSASIGITLYPSDGTTAEELLRNADTAMYRAKDSGRSTRKFFKERMNAEAVARIKLESELRQALNNRELTLHFQPQISLKNDRVVSAEALLRWEHPERGLLRPDKFINVAEDSGLIVPLGEWLLNTSCRQFVNWQRNKIAPRSVAVNVSIRQFREPNFVETVRSVLSDADMPPECLELEITESLLVEDLDRTVDTIAQLHDIGVRLAIDDFGTGYSSMGYLKRLSIDTIKIDRSFIRDIPGDDDAATIVKAIILMAHSLRKTVVAEGVETRDQLDFLRMRHCEYAQGYYFSEPLPVREFSDYMRSRRKVIKMPSRRRVAKTAS